MLERKIDQAVAAHHQTIKKQLEQSVDSLYGGSTSDWLTANRAQLEKLLGLSRAETSGAAWQALNQLIRSIFTGTYQPQTRNREGSEKTTSGEAESTITTYLGVEDKETEQRFGKITFKQSVIDSIDNLSHRHIEHEVGGLLIGYMENGQKHITNVANTVPQNLQIGQFDIMNQLPALRSEFERVKANDKSHSLQILGWWHTHPPEHTTAQGTIISAEPPKPSGGRLKAEKPGQIDRVSGDFGVNAYLTATFGTPQEMLIIETRSNDKPNKLALWRWNDASNDNETAVFQTGIPVTTPLEYQPDTSWPDPEYWQLPPGSKKELPMTARDIWRVNLEDL